MQNKKPMKYGSVKQKVYINAPPEKVYEAYVNPRIHSEFTDAKATGGSKVGQRMTAWDGFIKGKTVKLKRAKLIVQEWRANDFPKSYGYSSLKITLRKKGRGTELTMVHSRVPKENEKDLRSGWQEFYWKPMKKYFK